MATKPPRKPLMTKSTAARPPKAQLANKAARPPKHAAFKVFTKIIAVFGPNGPEPPLNPIQQKAKSIAPTATKGMLEAGMRREFP